MEKNYITSSSGGIGFVGLLAILFIALKLMGYIKWNWFWVLSPIWISFGLVIILCFIALIITILYLIFKN